jgi:hypothetical protein
MKTFTGWEYLLIDLANHFGHDKLLFEERIQWAMDNLNNLEALADQAEVKPLYIKAVMAIRKAQQGKPTGHLVGLDACCSGVQIMSAMTGCVDGSRSTGMIDPGVRADAYSRTTVLMNEELAQHGLSVNVSRKDAKQALMTSYYGSKATPKEIFGEDTPELNAFYAAAMKVAPGAWELLQDLLASWQPYALEHSWVLPDGFNAKVKVMKKIETRIEVDELDHATFTYEYYENQGSKTGLSNVANVTHSMDAWLLRSMHRRCNYDRQQAEYVAQCIEMELIERSLRGEPAKEVIKEFMTPKVQYYIDRYNQSTLADIVILPHLDQATVTCLSKEHLQALAKILTGMLQYQPFELVTVHDEFKAHANNMNWVRWQYREIMAEIAESNVLDDILSQIHGVPGSFNKLSFNLPAQIRNSEYALC